MKINFPNTEKQNMFIMRWVYPAVTLDFYKLGHNIKKTMKERWYNQLEKAEVYNSLIELTVFGDSFTKVRDETASKIDYSKQRDKSLTEFICSAPGWSYKQIRNEYFRARNRCLVDNIRAKTA